MNTEVKHPCFSFQAKYKYGRVHLPVAPACNMQCNYCDRKYDCVNESRPGVTSVVLTPKQALTYVRKIKQVDNGKIAVIGIAGPGDPFANAERTMETLRLIKAEYPDLIFCLSTNGLEIAPYIDELEEIGVSHITITINGIEATVLGEIYAWIRYQKKMYRGINAGRLLLDKQLEAVEKIKRKNLTLKINSVILPGLNDWHIPEVAKKMKEMKADIINCIPVYPNSNKFFEEIPKPTRELIADVRAQVSVYMPQMTHCARCRADAAGLLGQEMEEAKNFLKECSSLSDNAEPLAPYVAVASHEGLLVNQHLGEAGNLYIFKETEAGYEEVEKRETPAAGSGDDRWINLADTFNDCRAILVSGIGNKPLGILQDKGIKVLEMGGLISEGLDAIYKNAPLKSVKKRDAFACGSSCGGNAQGCM